MRRPSLQSKSNILFEATWNGTLCMTWLPTLNKSGRHNSTGKLCTGKATNTQKWVSNNEMNVKVCMYDIRDINQVNMSTN